jgi:DNA-binding NarL/FixJ family response regulator
MVYVGVHYLFARSWLLSFCTRLPITAFSRVIGVGFMTKILFIDNDEMAFQIRQCVARVLSQLPPVELFHACDATEGLQLMENLKPDVVVLDDELPEERDLFIESVGRHHPPILVQTESDRTKARKSQTVTYISKNPSLEGIHQTLLVATTIASRDIVGGESRIN